jgi:thiol:disulfide interchange protein DsbD
MKNQITQFLIPLAVFFSSTALAQQGAFHDSRDRVSVEVVVEPEQAVAGSDFVIAVVLNHEKHWHTHTNDPQVPEALGDPDDYIATKILIETPDDSPLTIHDSFIQWPDPVIVEVGFVGDRVDYGVFSEKIVVYIPVSVSNNAEVGGASFRVRAIFQACDDTTCIKPTPQEGQGSRWEQYGSETSIQIVSATQSGESVESSDLFENFESSIFGKIHAGATPPSEAVEFDLFGMQFSLNPSGTFGMLLLILVAMGGGFLLNLTPCVLPVIPLKIMGLSKSAGNRKTTLILGVWMMLGVMALWLAIGASIAVFSGFTAINQLFQYPAFTIALGVFIGVMAIGMGGLFSIRLPHFVYTFNPKHDSWLGSFLFGVMTAVLSTPCTAPFMGAAAAWATTQSALWTLAVFGAIGFGMAVPYLVLAAFPHLVDKMPKAGASSDVIKQVMGLLMLAAAAYFLGVGLSGILQQEGAPPTRIYLWAVALCVGCAGFWLAWRTLCITKRSGMRIIFVGIGIAMFGTSIVVGNRLTEKGPIDWAYYTPEVLQESLDEGNTVVLEFTAEWCLNCKLLESTVLHSSRIVEAFESEKVSPIKIDLTGNNVAGNALLDEVGGLRIPLLIILGPDGEELFRGDFYTVDQVLNAIASASSDSVD